MDGDSGSRGKTVMRMGTGTREAHRRVHGHLSHELVEQLALKVARAVAEEELVHKLAVPLDGLDGRGGVAHNGVPGAAPALVALSLKQSEKIIHTSRD